MSVPDVSSTEGLSDKDYLFESYQEASSPPAIDPIALLRSANRLAIQPIGKKLLPEALRKQILQRWETLVEQWKRQQIETIARGQTLVRFSKIKGRSFVYLSLAGVAGIWAGISALSVPIICGGFGFIIIGILGARGQSRKTEEIAAEATKQRLEMEDKISQGCHELNQWSTTHAPLERKGA